MPIRTAVAALLGLVLTWPVAACAERAAAVATALPRSLLLFDTGTPAQAELREVTGLGANESIVGIDGRPTTSELFALTATTGSVANSFVRTYTIDPGTGVATLVGQTTAAIAGAADVPSGIDFNPVVDRIRIVNTNDENARINPSTGALAANDTDLTPAGTSTIIAAAYDRSASGATATTLYAIDRNDSELVVQGGIDGVPSPNAGVLTSLGALGFALDQTSDGGFDIAPGGTAYAALTDNADDRTRLYTVNLTTGAATAIGVLPVAVRSLAILPPLPPDAVAPAGLADPGDRPRLATLQSPGLVVGFSCDEACTAVATLTAREVAVATGQGTLPAAGVGELTLTPAADAAKILRKARRSGRLRGTLSITFTDGTGNAHVRERPLELRR